MKQGWSFCEAQLWGNQLSSIESSDFDGLTNLAELSLEDNNLSSLEFVDVSGLANHLIHHPHEVDGVSCYPHIRVIRAIRGSFFCRSVNGCTGGDQHCG